MELADVQERKSSIFDTAHTLAVQKFQEAKRKVSLKRVLAIDDTDTEDPADIDVDDLLEDVEKDDDGEEKTNSNAEESPDQVQGKREEVEAEDNATTEKGTVDRIASEPIPVNAAL